MYRLASSVTVLRDGRYIGTWGLNEVSQDDIVKAMVGREITQFFPPRHAKIDGEVLRVEKLSRTGYFKDVSFTVNKGEIVGLTGLIGAGRTEVCEAIYGVNPPDSGEIFVEGKKVWNRHASHGIKEGIGYLPEDRLKQGLVLDWQIYRNVSLASLEQFGKHGFMDEGQERKIAKTLGEKLEVKATSVHDKVSTLSGGNQQKVIVAKLLTRDMKVIILDEPTKGVDVGAKTAIYEIMNHLAEEGYGILMVSSEMPEVLGMCDRIVVMREGRVSAILDAKKTTQEEILQASMVLYQGKQEKADKQEKKSEQKSQGVSAMKNSQSSKLSDNARELGLLGFIVVLALLFQLRNPEFLTFSNLRDLLNNTAILGVLSVGMMMILLTGVSICLLAQLSHSQVW